MPYYKFGTNDIFYNTIEANPQCKFLIHQGKTYYNEEIPDPAGNRRYNTSHNNPHDNNIDHVKTGDINLYEMNVNRKEVYALEQSSRSIAFNAGGTGVTGAYIKVDVANSELDFERDSLTISCWIKTKDTAAMLIGKPSDSSPLITIKIVGGNIETNIGQHIHTASTPISDNSWHHIVAVFDVDRTNNTATSTTYIDGIGDTPTAAAFAAFQKNDFEDFFHIGQYDVGDEDYYWFTGSIAEVAMWKSALSASAVKSIYNNGVPTNLKQTFGNYSESSNLVGWWAMGDGIINPDLWLKFEDSLDSSPNNITTTFVNGATAATAASDPTSFLELGGTGQFLEIDAGNSSKLDLGLDEFEIEFKVKFNNNNTSEFVSNGVAATGDYPIFCQDASSSNYENLQGFFGLRYNFDKVINGATGAWYIESATPYEDNNYTNKYYISDSGVAAGAWYDIRIQRVQETNSDGDLVLRQNFYREGVSKDTRTTNIYPVSLNGRKMRLGAWWAGGTGATATNGSLDGDIANFKISRSDGETTSTFPLILDQSDNDNHGTMINMSPSDISDYSEESMIRPYITKDGTALAFKTYSLSDYQSFEYGELIAGSYPLSAGISIEHFAAITAPTDKTEYANKKKALMETRPHIAALKNTINSYTPLSPRYSVMEPTSPTGATGSDHTDFNPETMIKWDYDELTLVSIPSIFYGSSIEKGSVSLKYYLDGTLQTELQDSKRNGELISGASGTTGPAGIVLYNEGFIILFDNTENYWLDHWGHATGASHTSALSFNGTNRIPTLTMLAHAKKGELNHSNNPTYLTYADKDVNIIGATGGISYTEKADLTIANTVKSAHEGAEAGFQKQVWISKIGIYDENKNLIAIAKLANPVRKTEDRDFTFKLKLDF